ncbi:receptor-type tyrosine-protein phosphatase H [Hemicordylus capensis]|uniref:receptor-type tyrosine-protein phosphatase H n=1 Tax=Hemicordylus capensis TaxID=884348 RepID=UPI002304698A|nr:receptor-type tyrosine-protein phosphatase H [Hemicordylus capensis]
MANAEVEDCLGGNQVTVSVVKNRTSLPDGKISPCTKLTSKDVLVVEDKTNHSVTLCWRNPPVSPAYKYSFAADTIYTANISGLSAGQDYKMAVYMIKPDGNCSQWSSTNVTTQPSAVLNVLIEARNTSSLTIGWKPPEDSGNNTNRYEICLSNITLSTPPRGPGCTVASRSPHLEDSLRAGVTYSVAVYTLTSNNVPSIPTEINATTAPNQPKNIMVNVTSYNTHNVSISWNPPEDPNANNYTYWVSWARSEDDTALIRNASTVNFTYIIKCLEPGNFYSVKLKSCISGIMSAEATLQILTAPLPPTNLSIRTINQTAATLSWERPNSAFNDFGLQLWEKPDKLMENLTFPNSTAGLNGLTPGTNYTFRVFSVARGSNLKTESIPVELENATKPDRVGHVECQSLEGGYSLKVSWLHLLGGYTTFKVIWLGHSMEVRLNHTELNNLQPARSYQIQVATVWYDQEVLSQPVVCHTDDTGVILGALFAVLLFLLILGLLLLYFRRRRKKNILEKKQQKPAEKLPGDVAPVPVANFPSYCCERSSDSAFGFANEYQQLQDIGTEQPQSVAQQPENQVKNRYSNVLPYDSSRVLLTLKSNDSHSDYINASYIPGYQRENEFIAAQGPLPRTLHDFWRMIWEQQITTLVMLTNCVESGRVKCEHYWPLDYTPCTYDDITVSVITETILPDWTIRDFTIKRMSVPEARLARHYHYTSWPDHGVPQITSTILHFRDLVREHIEQHEGRAPTLVHCSAGVGRTGTFIALDSLLRQAQNKGEICVFSFVQRMRMNRPLMIQTEAQYIFLHQCLLDGIQPASQNDCEKTEDTVVYENTWALQGYEMSRV